MYDLHTGLDWRLLTKRLLWTLWVPVSSAFLLDRLLDTSPYLLLGTGIFCIPLATVVVLRKALWQLDRVIERVAPLDENRRENGCAGDSDNLPDTDKTIL